MSLKDFLSNIKAEAELITYQAAKTTDHNKGPTNKLKKFIVTPGTGTNGNTFVQSTFGIHSQEEADTLLLYHALSIGKHHVEVVIASLYPDVFLMMVQLYPGLLCYILCFHTGTRNVKRNIPVQRMYNKLGHRRASAILGFHAQTGSDMSGRFARRTSEWCFKVFMACGYDTRQLHMFKVYTKVNDFRWFLYANRAAEWESSSNDWLAH